MLTASSVELLTTRQLRGRGWSRRMIARFLKSPDAAAKNPHIHSGRPMRLYNAVRVRELELSDAVATSMAAAKERGAKSSEFYKLKADALSAIAETIEVHILNIGCHELSRLALAEYGQPASDNLQNKNEVAYLLSYVKNAEWGLDAYFWHQGIRQARLKLRRRVLVEILESYPHLGDAVLEISRDEAGFIQFKFAL